MRDDVIADGCWSALLRAVIVLLMACALVTIVAGFDPTLPYTYEYAGEWGSHGEGDGQFWLPRGIAVDNSGNIYVVDGVSNRIQKFDSTGTFITKWGSGYGEYYDPTDVAVDSAGNVYVADNSNNLIQKFTSAGTFITTIGSSGSGDGQFTHPGGVTVDRAGNVYVVYTGNNRIQKFTSTGTFITAWGTEGSGDGQFDSPEGVAVDSSGNVYVLDSGNARVQKFDSTGTFIMKWGTFGGGDLQFLGPAGITVDGEGNVYVADWGSGIQKFTSTGSLIIKFDDEMSFPGGIAVDSAWNVYVTDNTQDRVLKFAPVNLPPVASFTMDTALGSAPLTVAFTDTSKNQPTSWNWDFGDGTTATNQHPVHIFKTVGEYTIRLTATNAIGSNSTINSVQVLKPMPYVEPSPLDGAQISSNPLIVISMGFWGYVDGDSELKKIVMKRHSDGLIMPGTTQAWSFRRGYNPFGYTTYTLLSYNRSYSNLNPDTKYDLYYDGSVIASYTTGFSSVIAGFAATPTSGTTPLQVQFTDQSTGSPTSWSWAFGDGTTSTLQSPSHTYTTAGTYTVSLTIRNAAGATNTKTQTNLISVTSPIPLTANFGTSPTSGTTPLQVQFTDQSTGSPTSWSWTFGDGTTSTLQSPSHTYTTAGTYTVSLTVRNAAGATNTKTRTNLISVTSPIPPTTTTTVPATPTVTLTVSPTGTEHNPPVADFTATPTSGAGPLTVRFTDTSTGLPTSWYWFFGDNLLSTEQNPSHIYMQSGTYTVNLVAINANGYTIKTKTDYITVTQADALTANFAATPTSGPAPLQVQFTDQSGGGPTSWFWIFGDGTASTDQSPSHTYSQAGTYTTSLTVRNTAGLTSVKEGTITVTAAPQTLLAAFTVNTQTAVAGQTIITGTDTSTGSPTTWYWDFGDGFTASIPNINHFYSEVGSYTMSLTVTSGSQTSTTSKTITVTAVPVTTVTTSVTTVVTVVPGQPYNGPHTAPGTVQAEDYDIGGNTVAYYDTTTGTAGGAYRTDDVDIEAGGSGYDVGWIVGGEYLTYSVDAATVGDYPITIRAANPDAAEKVVTVSVGSSSTTIRVPSTGSFDVYNTFTSAGTLSLAAGRNIVKVTFGASRMNLDYITIGAGIQPYPTTTITVQPTTMVTVQPTTGAASFTVNPTSGKKSLTVALTDTTTGGNPASRKWTCGNGQTFSGKTVGLNRIWYNNAGTYTITLTVTDADGSTRTATKTITATN